MWALDWSKQEPQESAYRVPTF